ncbi:hypothetical protein, partial [Mesorhizobium japonicum]|uniref:hypothetical protein n=1 Tax=Mesorhizobium japonicum TaxID=2066070 RepID=UPI003B5B991E
PGVEHIVVGEPGVFTVRVEHTPGKGVWARGETLSTNGRTTSYVRDACATARAIRQRLEAATGLSAPVTAVIAFVGAASVRAAQPIGDGTVEVRVVGGADLLVALAGPDVLTAPEVERIADAVRQLEAPGHPHAHATSARSERRARGRGLAGAIGS